MSYWLQKQHWLAQRSASSKRLMLTRLWTGTVALCLCQLVCTVTIWPFRSQHQPLLCSNYLSLLPGEKVGDLCSKGRWLAKVLTSNKLLNRNGYMRNVISSQILNILQRRLAQIFSQERVIKRHFCKVRHFSSNQQTVWLFWNLKKTNMQIKRFQHISRIVTLHIPSVSSS